MCGGRGTRLEMGEKPLVEVGRKAMVDRVIGAVSPVVGTVHAAPSPHTPETRAHLAGRVPLVGTPGEGYVEDLTAALAVIGRPVLTVTADLPLLRPADVRAALDAYGSGSLTVGVPAERKRELGVSVDTSFEHEGREIAPTGLNVVGDHGEAVRVLDRIGLAVNVNTCSDLEVASAVISERF
ncbi:GTP--adenosylcobinamide-phosphate guanylyltransferase [Halalkalicoccus jeotgali]|uniref:GTP:adenosylcobinamide-phosphate guanylyltransferase n=1 Tax=Halalkalicoccus jeotgali (strain DSM 18796 / CECT 7217 / JCM 14584 / KCTC 4019 / B3) TaxID=795797 RepID=D8J6Y6_HALJB|nr:GTP--adenosylcobinamide-phosphate guanylyltransferase [Halalkalicoccus jeotgali]ADJ15939.1 GTP:adenosylcobinamide-phosphate guanylyltransferase [Halalkalicoccus jeotgali B3]ELY38035.1 GTP:adenosylcobinamide-phosphate guanylyltransferase [Halalkalicoccus jeotgali B3]